MRIAVSRSGGIAGMTRRAVVDTDGREDAETWHELVSGMLGSQGDGNRQVRDAFVWRIEVDDRRIVLGDRELSGPLRTLAERALDEGARHP